MPLVEQELRTLPQHPTSPPVFSGFVLLDLLFLCNVLLIVVYPFVLFLLAIVLSVIRRLVNSDYPFGIFKLFHCLNQIFSTSYEQRMLDYLNLKGNVSPAPNEQLLIRSGWLLVTTHFQSYLCSYLFRLKPMKYSAFDIINTRDGYYVLGGRTQVCGVILQVRGQ